MPYISQSHRALVDGPINQILRELHRLPEEDRGGVLNYIITRIVVALAARSYRSMRGYVGDIQCCLLEFYRRHLAPYEDEKITQNGDVR